MKREIKYLTIGLLLTGLSCGVLYFLSGSDTGSDTAFSQAPAQVSMLGPYAKNINITENIGAYSLNISAENLFMKKGRIMGFSTALHKKFVAKNIRMSLYKKGEKKLELSKDRVILDPFMRNIAIDSPRILYPEGMDQPKKVSLEKEKQQLVIQYQKKTDVWNLEK